GDPWRGRSPTEKTAGFLRALFWRARCAWALLLLVDALVFEDGFVEAGDALGGDELGAVFFVAGLEAEDGGAAVVVLEEDALEGGLAVIEADEAIVAAARGGGGGEDDDVA